MNFKVGDKVKLVRIDNEDERYKKYLGEIFTVSRVYRDYVDVEEGQEDVIMPFKKNLELVEYTYENLKKSTIGTKVTYDDGKVFIKTGMNTYSKEICSCISEVRNYDDMFQGKIIKIEEPRYETVYESKVEILDEVEKRYLSNVIRPFKENVRFITKRRYWIDSTEYNDISICIKNNSNIVLPRFIANNMYKGMEIEKTYSLEELGL